MEVDHKHSYKFYMKYFYITNMVVIDICIVAMGWDYVSVDLQPLTGPLSISQMIYDLLWSNSGIVLTGKNQRTPWKTCPSATLSCTNPSWIVPGTNLGLPPEKLVINHLSYGMGRHGDCAKLSSYIIQI